MMSKFKGYTLVQHSAFVGKNDSLFRHGVELQRITKQQIGKVQNAGGLIFNTYTEADDKEHSENYPHDCIGLYPSANGTFSKKKIDGSPIYIPKKEGSEKVPE